MLKDFLAIYIKSKAISKAIKTYPPAGLLFPHAHFFLKKKTFNTYSDKKRKNPFSMHRDERDKVS